MQSRTHGVSGSTAVWVGVALLAIAGCTELGLTNRVLWRVPSPDGTLVAVCQEIPEIDGPAYDIRVERPDGRLIRRLFRSGDGDPCTEVVWSPDGATLAVLSGHVARVRVVNVAEELKRAPTTTSQWSVRQIDFSWNGQLRLGKKLRFTDARHFELTTCPYSLAETQRTHTTRCLSDEVRLRLEVLYHPAGS